MHPSLNALVYGESVINDAVGIVLYRTFTGFLVTEVTAEASVYGKADLIDLCVRLSPVAPICLCSHPILSSHPHFLCAHRRCFCHCGYAGFSLHQCCGPASVRMKSSYTGVTRVHSCAFVTRRNIRWQRALESEILKLTTAVATPLRATLSGLRSRDSRRTLASPRATTVAMASVAAAAIATPSATSRHGFVPETPHRRAVLSLSTVLEEQSLSLASGTAETAVLLVFAYAGECL